MAVMRSYGSVVVVVLGVAAAARGQEDAGPREDAWQVVATGPVTVKNRSVPGSDVKEIWAEGILEAPAVDVQEALMRVDRLRMFMPYMKDARVVSEPFDDGSSMVYTLLELPVLGRRDYVVRLSLKEALRADGTGTFRNEWHAVPTFLPLRSGIVRIRQNSGSWVVTPIGAGSKSWAVYRFTVDPGGWVPAFLANLGNERGVRETYDAVAQEARRIRDVRIGQKPPGQATSARLAP